MRTVEIHIKRRDNPDAPQRWEEFEIPYRSNLNVISCLMEIRKNPVTRQGKQTTPPSWDMNCLEQVCGICTMVINGRVRQSCSALVDNLDQPIRITWQRRQVESHANELPNRGAIRTGDDRLTRSLGAPQAPCEAQPATSQHQRTARSVAPHLRLSPRPAPAAM